MQDRVLGPPRHGREGVADRIDQGSRAPTVTVDVPRVRNLPRRNDRASSAAVVTSANDDVMG